MILYRCVIFFLAVTAVAVVLFWQNGSLYGLTGSIISREGGLLDDRSSPATTRVSRNNESTLSGVVSEKRVSADVKNETRGQPADSLYDDGDRIPTLVAWQKRHPTRRISQAYMTLISSPEYDIGAQLLVCRLRQFSPNTTILVVVDASILPLRSMHYYQRMGVDLIQVSNPGKEVSNTSVSSEIRIGTYTKLQLWNLTSVDVAVYMDADTLPVQNPRDLFHELTLQQDFGAVGNPSYMNTGILVFRPSHTTYTQLMERLRTNNYAKSRNDPTEQDLLVSHFGGSRAETKFIDGKYNYRPLHHPLMGYAIIVHYIGNPKPWTTILGQDTTIQGYASTQANHLPTWSIQLYQCEMERFFTECHTPATTAYGLQPTSTALSRCWPLNETDRRRRGRRRLRLANGFET